MGVLIALLPAAGHAQSINKLEQQIQALQTNYQAQIDNLQAQIRALKEQQAQQDVKTEAVRQQAVQVATVEKKRPHVVQTKNNRFGLESADGKNSIYLTGRVHFDVGGYDDYHRSNSGEGEKAPAELADGENFRRARIGVVGKFLGDFDYGLIYDFGGSSDTITTGQSGAPTSGIENAYITYNGFYKPHNLIPLAFDIGAIDIPWTLGEATSSNDIMFMERASPQIIATEFGGGDARPVFGVRSNNDRYYFNAYLTGPSTGALHSDTTATCPVGQPSADCDGPQLAFLTRATYQFIQTDDFSLHLGADFGDLLRPRGSTNLETITLSDRPELRIDPTTFISTGAMEARSGTVFDGEAAATLGNAYVDGEFYHYSVNRITVPDVEFNGGYVEASYAIGGKRHYLPATGAYSDVIPEHPLDLDGSGLGAVELAIRYSRVDLNDDGVAKDPVYGGDQKTYAVGLNYHPNVNMRFMLDLEHVDIYVPGGDTAKGASFNDFALRSQLNF
jgi:phosphate-selective porin OprO/OprP